MLVGRVNEYLDPIIQLPIPTPGDGIELIDMIVDTGFIGEITLPFTLIELLEAPFINYEETTLGDGRVDFLEMYMVEVIWNGTSQYVSAMATDNDVATIGMKLLENYSLKINVRAGGEVEISKSN